MPDTNNVLILDLLDKPEDIEIKTKHRIGAWCAKRFNRVSKHMKIHFKNDKYNRYFDLKYHHKSKLMSNILQGGMSNIEQAVNIHHLLTQVLRENIPGDIVELGCNEGTTSILLQKTLDQHESIKKITVYDSFEGLPEKSEKDGNTGFGKGRCLSSREQLVKNFTNHETKLPTIVEGWFKDTIPEKLPHLIAFAHLDGDFYSSIMESLEGVYPRLAAGAVVVVDDYCDPAVHDVHNVLVGVKQACDEFFADKPESVHVLLSGTQTHGYFRKQ